MDLYTWAVRHLWAVRLDSASLTVDISSAPGLEDMECIDGALGC